MHLVTAPVEERREGAGQGRDYGDRPGLEEDVEHTRTRADRIGELGGDREELGTHPEDRVAEVGDLRARLVALEHEDRDRGEEIEDRRAGSDRDQAVPEVRMGSRLAVEHEPRVLPRSLGDPNDAAHRPSIPTGAAGIGGWRVFAAPG